MSEEDDINEEKCKMAKKSQSNENENIMDSEAPPLNTTKKTSCENATIDGHERRNRHLHRTQSTENVKGLKKKQSIEGVSEWDEAPNKMEKKRVSMEKVNEFIGRIRPTRKTKSTDHANIQSVSSATDIKVNLNKTQSAENTAVADVENETKTPLKGSRSTENVEVSPENKDEMAEPGENEKEQEREKKEKRKKKKKKKPQTPSAPVMKNDENNIIGQLCDQDDIDIFAEPDNKDKKKKKNSKGDVPSEDMKSGEKKTKKAKVEESTEAVTQSEMKKKTAGKASLASGMKVKEKEKEKKKKRPDKDTARRKKKKKENVSDENYDDEKSTDGIAGNKKKNNNCKTQKKSTDNNSFDARGKGKAPQETSARGLAKSIDNSGRKTNPHKNRVNRTGGDKHSSRREKKRPVVTRTPRKEHEEKPKPTQNKLWFLPRFLSKLTNKKLTDDNLIKPVAPPTDAKSDVLPEYSGPDCEYTTNVKPFDFQNNKNNGGNLFPNGHPFWSVPDRHSRQNINVKELVVSKNLGKFLDTLQKKDEFKRVDDSKKFDEPKKEIFDPYSNEISTNTIGSKSVMIDRWPEYANKKLAEHKPYDLIMIRTFMAYKNSQSKPEVKGDLKSKILKRSTATVTFGPPPKNKSLYDRRHFKEKHKLVEFVKTEKKQKATPGVSSATAKRQNERKS